MGRQGPLTALALGRSPYDDVVQGEGPDAPGGSKQEYDEKGRPVNPETKRINKEIVRSHNEVMQVIGVAEPDPNSNDIEVQSARRYLLYEQIIGGRMDRLAKSLTEVGVWGVMGLRRRVMVYKPFSYRPFWGLATACREEIPRPFSSLLLAGLPTELARRALEWIQNNIIDDLLDGVVLPSVAWTLLDAFGGYIRTHLASYIFLQRMGIIHEFRLPGLGFFIPFSSTSPIPAPPPAPDLSFQSLLQWCGGVLLQAAPMIAFAMWRRHGTTLMHDFSLQIYHKLPNIHRILDSRSHPETYTEFSGSQPGSSQARNTSDDMSNNHQGETTEEDLLQTQQPVAGVSRRPSAFSGRAEDYGSEEEDNGAVSGTLISFDVEASEATEAPQGVWSAELRPTMGSDTRSQNGGQQQAAVYLKNFLTKQPLIHASVTLARAAVTLALAPVETVALRMLARSYCATRGMPLGRIWEPYLWGTFSWRWLATYLAVDFFHLSLQSDIWAGVTYLGRSYHLTPEEWTSMTAEQHAEMVRGREQE